jgi:hypothetical protein
MSNRSWNPLATLVLSANALCLLTEEFVPRPSCMFDTVSIKECVGGSFVRLESKSSCVKSDFCILASVYR